MSARKDVYLLVKSLIVAIPEIKHFDVWNDNIERDGEVDSFPTPAVFFEWTKGLWEASIKGKIDNRDDLFPNQNGDLEFTLHIVIKKTSVEDQDELLHYDIEDLVYKAVHFQSILDPNSDFIEGKIQRFADDTILRHKVWREWPVVYTVRVLECGLSGIDSGDLTDAQPADFEVVPELVIKNKLDQKPGTLIINIADK